MSAVGQQSRILAAELADLAADLERFDGLGDVLARVASLSLRLPGCDSATVVAACGPHGVTVEATDEAGAEVDRAQFAFADGPAVEALRHAEPRRIDDTATEQRWQRVSALAFGHGLRAVLALPLRTGRATTGALVLYGRTPDAFAETSQELALVYAGESEVALTFAEAYYAGRRVTEQLRAALATRSVIEQARGILMARGQLDAAQAFDELRQRSQRANVKLRDVARDVVDAAEVDSRRLSEMRSGPRPA